MLDPGRTLDALQDRRVARDMLAELLVLPGRDFDEDLHDSAAEGCTGGAEEI